MSSKTDVDVYVKTRKTSFPSAENIGYILFCIGIILSALSIDYSVYFLALFSTSLIFWSILLIYFRPTNPASNRAITSMLLQHYSAISHTKEISKDHKVVYYSPPNIFGLDNSIVLVSKSFFSNDIAEITSYEEGHDSYVTKIIPPGQNLLKEIEDNQKIRFSSLNPLSIRVPIEDALVDEFELVKKMQFQIFESEAFLELYEPTFYDLYEEPSLKELITRIGGPIESSIACALSRATHKPVIIEELRNLKNEKKIIAKYRILDDIYSASNHTNSNNQES